jgi:hypothetical protein
MYSSEGSMTKRTTIKFEALKAEANKVFRESQDGYADGRRAIQSFVDSVLMDAGQYKGFGYLTKDRVAPGNSFGIEWAPVEPGQVQPKFFDQTRIEFY